MELLKNGEFHESETAAEHPAASRRAGSVLCLL
jgi:hypothetical protein